MTSGRPLRFWGPLPFVCATVAFVLAGHLLTSGDRQDRSEGLVLLGSGLICFSIGCVCRTSWGISFAKAPHTDPSSVGPLLDSLSADVGNRPE